MHLSLKKVSLVLCTLLLCATLFACSKDDNSTGGFFQSSNSRASVSSEEVQFTTPTEGDTIATFTTQYGSFSVVLYTALAPQACENFLTLASEGFYDGTALYRIVSGFCVQGGLDAEGYASSAWGGSSFPMEVTDSLHHYAGALCAAPDEDGNAASVFYIVQASAADVSDAMVSAMQAADYRTEVIDAYTAAGGVPYLDYTDTVFGQVYDGMDVIDEIAALETDENDAPLEEVLITSITVSTYQG